MHPLKAIFDFYLNASIHVALGVTSLVGVSLLLLNISPNYNLLGFVFFSTIVCYNFIKYGVEADKYLIVSNSYHKYIQFLSFICFGLALYFLTFLGPKMWWSIAFFGIISSLYAIPLLPQTGNLRNFGGLKIFIVAFVWTGFSVWLPTQEANLKPDWDLFIMLVQRFVFVLALILPFEIRDLQWDAPELRTLPQLLGEKRTKLLGVALVLLFFLMTFLKDVISLYEVVSQLIISVVLLLVFLFRKDVRGVYFASFWVEGVPILWVILVYALRELI